MELNKVQLRSMPTGLSLREGDESRTLEGHAIVTGVETTLWEGSDYREIEIIDQSCLNADFMKEQDVKLNLLHERNTTIGRSNKGEGNLQLDTREDGLHFTCEAPKCDLGDRAVELVRSKVYTGCSFEFYPKDYEVSERKAADGKTEYVIRHKAFERMDAVTIALDPAYEQTSVGLREVYQREHPEGSVLGGTASEEEARRQEEAARAREAREQAIRLQTAQRERDLYLMTLGQ